MITATLSSGAAQSVSLAASGLPSGVTSSFSQGTCAPTCYSTLTMTTSSSAPARSYPITVTADSGNISRATTFTLAVAPRQTAALMPTPALAPVAGVATLATLPQRTFDTSTTPTRTGKVITVKASGGTYTTLKAALANFNAGDEIVVDPNVVEALSYDTLVLPYKGDNAPWTIIRTAAVSSLPNRGTRINADMHAQYMPKLQSNSQPYPVMTVAPKANHYWITGFEFRADPAMAPGPHGVFTLITLGNNETFTRADYSSYIVFDRCYLHGELKRDFGARGGIFVMGNYMSVEDSVLRWFKSWGTHSQAIWVSDGDGPVRIHNNYVDAASQNIFLGGGGSARKDFPKNVTITHNHVRKDQDFLDNPTWNSNTNGGYNFNWSFLFETKSAQYVLLEGNIFEHTNAASAAHQDTCLSMQNQNNYQQASWAEHYETWARAEDFTVRYNICRHVGGSIQMGTNRGGNGGWLENVAARISIYHNLFYDILNPGGAVAAAQGILDGTRTYHIDILSMNDAFLHHNTFVQGHMNHLTTQYGWYTVVIDGTTQMQNLDIADNIIMLARLGWVDNSYTDQNINGTGWVQIDSLRGPASTAARSPGFSYHHNLIYATQDSIDGYIWPVDMRLYPNNNNNSYELHLDYNVGFANAVPITDAPVSGYALASGSGKNSASDGTDRGADIATVLAKTAGVEVGMSPLP